ncbi:Thiol-disulfide isomerase or thioredoxin [Oryzisolibacter propanilivorax]|uniref:Thiol-disulfide isomerase or thioredoxin n=1 Tax=Oryzisolibacter propanilivorax TaxID=1527607 RepID=A0A1G9U860_9BURK|nr:TlpA disulfide reductase family protein [Oryzisolibacter propanilivorax]SDM56131.1 Thiol-disulfide isomerase or thioredoxin [Oryzisolibacter propanilivorax]
MHAQMLTLGPLVLPWAGLLALLAWLSGSTLHDRLLRRAGLPPGPHAWALALAVLAAARLAFVLRYAGDYAAAPWTALDIRDGGWAPIWGWAAGAVYAGVLWLRRRPARRAVAAGLAAGACLWLAGQLALRLAQPRTPITLPDWQGVALDARSVRLSDLQGRPLVVNLWASWCPPCRREMPVLRQAQQQHPQVRFLWVDQGEAPEVVLAFARAQGLPEADVLLDVRSELGQRLGHRALPTTLFFGADARLAAVRSGELSAATLAEHLARIRPPPLSGQLPKQ